MTTMTKDHIGRKISRIRELRDMKQEALAQAMGTNQQAISIIENSAVLEEDRLLEVAKALGVSPDAIKNFSEEAVFNYFNSFNHFNESPAFNNSCTFNPLDKMLEVFDENKSLYERLIKAEKDLVLAEKDKVSYLEKLLNINKQ